MVQCEMCGTETGAPTTIRVEGAELEVCDNCTEFGTAVTTQDTSSTSTKYSTSSSSGTSSGSSGSGGEAAAGATGGSSGSSRRRDMFDEMDEVAQDYDQRIREAREARDLSQGELADQLNEKASLIGKLEHGDVLPSDEVQRKLERHLDISLAAGGSPADDAEWEGGTGPGGTTLGDVVKRKD